MIKIIQIVLTLIFLPLSSIFAGPGENIGKVGDIKNIQKINRVDMYDNYFNPKNTALRQDKQLNL